VTNDEVPDPARDEPSGSPTNSPTSSAMASGMRTVGSSQVAQLVLQLMSVAVLARLLAPDAFGLVAMVMVVIGVAELFRDMGLSNAAIQAAHLSVGLRSNLFWANSAMGAVLTLLSIAMAPAIAALYDRPQLIGITIALSPTFLISGLATQYRVHLIRSLRFKALAAISLVALSVAMLAAITAALGGLGVWAIVVQSLTLALATLVLLVMACRWTPGMPTRGTGMRGMMGLGTAFLASSLLTYVRMNADSFIIGHRLGAEALGLYNRSVQVVRNPIRQLQQPFGSVIIPVASRLRDDDDAFMRALREYQPLMGYAICSLSAVVVAAPRDVVLLVLGAQWLDAAPVIAVVAASAAIAAAAGPVSWLYTSRGLGGALLVYTLFTTAWTVALTLMGSQFGLIGAATGYLASTVLSFPLTFVRAQRLTGLPMVRLAVECARPAVLLGVVWVVSLSVRTVWQPPVPAGLVVALVCVAVVGGAAAALRSYRRDYAQIIRSLRSLR
jgi:O-antigen/teichoic acid export membrane protein